MNKLISQNTDYEIVADLRRKYRHAQSRELKEELFKTKMYYEDRINGMEAKRQLQVFASSSS